jgi:Tfp pilus assembly protein PilN
MIRSNLATRPFYNERAVRAWLIVIAALVAAATLFNVTHILRYTRDDSTAATQAAADAARAQQARGEAARLRASIDTRQVERISSQAQTANALIDRRTFSWTGLLNLFETTLPDQVRITSVRPEVSKDGSMLVTVAVVARGVDDVNEFLESLETTRSFAQVLSREEHMNDDGQLEAVLEAVYRPAAAESSADGGAAR